MSSAALPETFITVIVPVRLGWEPTYSAREALEPGDRVRVKLMNREYVAVVSAVNVTPDIEKERILPIISVENGLEKVSLEEIEFWRFLAGYYMCSVGEVFKMAYPSGLTAAELKRSNIHLQITENSLPEPAAGVPSGDTLILSSLRQGMATGKPLLLEGALPQDRIRLSASLAGEFISKGKSVLWLFPFPEDVSAAQKLLKPVFGDALLAYSQNTTLSRRREIAKLLRNSESPALVIGTKSALFLPWSRLGLVIVDEEQETAYKNVSSAPHYNARDAAVVLSGIHSAATLLCAGVPSLESCYNCRKGRYLKVSAGDVQALSKLKVIDTASEFRKRGMAGEVSFKLRDEVRRVISEGGKVLFVDALPMGDDFKEKVLPAFSADEADKMLFSDINGFRRIKMNGVGLVALLRAELLCSRQDFRADEKALHKLVALGSLGPMLVVQTARAQHPVFKLSADALLEQLLDERSVVSLPPFSRQVDVLVDDTNEARANKLSKLLYSRLSAEMEKVVGPMGVSAAEGHSCQCIRVTFPKDAMLGSNKLRLKRILDEFEKEYKYAGHISPDVDPR